MTTGLDTHLIRTERLQLRVPTSACASAYADYLRRNKRHFAGAMPKRKPSFFAEETWIEAFASLADDVAKQKRITFLLYTQADQIAGDVSITEVVRGAFQSAFLGYKLDRDTQGNGLMTEALGAVLNFAFETWNLHRISANHRPENVRSARLLRRLGFSVEGYARDYLRLDGAWRDHVLTALYNHRWKDV